MIRKKLLIKGKVQGVGFRFFCQYIASTLSLTGYAKNLNDGDVLIEVQGISNNIVKFKSSLLKGNNFCKVIDIIEDNIPLQEKEKRFSMY
ncbi:acylphosphatase [Clostridium tarantellae]|uniref:Acylphosphatase n=1 Tax=Clostridium tarantellae TaxID=39493 RepID=A0A6I1MW29_9CLOT|nr:acylphosphatase [Clostridium tarantellae]MPQ44379.1 acylphosphatase [Clostridium tarantellae]